jgi:hypothetical protein
MAHAQSFVHLLPIVNFSFAKTMSNKSDVSEQARPHGRAKWWKY